MFKKNNPAGSITKCYSFERGRQRDSESVSMLGFSLFLWIVGNECVSEAE